MTLDFQQTTGLTECEGVELLCLWHNERTYSIWRPTPTCIRNMGQEVASERRSFPLFTESLDSMARITGAMNQEERDMQLLTLRKVLTGKKHSRKFKLDDVIVCVCADAHTRAIAAILALGLGREN